MAAWLRQETPAAGASRSKRESLRRLLLRLALLLLLSVTVEQLYKPATNVLTCNQALAGLLYLMLQVRLVLPVAFSYYFPSISKRRITAVAKHSPPGHRRAAGLPLCQHHGSEIGARGGPK